MADEFERMAMPNGGFMLVPTLATRFWQKVAVGKADECWLWQGATNNSGYGTVRAGKWMRPVGQIALELSDSPRPPSPNDHALHGDTCISRRCVNPRHLRWGSNAENVADRERLGRNIIPHIRGERHGAAKVTDEIVRQIRASTEMHKVDAARFGISRSQVGLIRKGKSWAHVR